MSLTYWLLIIALILMLAAGVYLLTRKPSSPRDEHEVSEYGPGGSRVAAGDAGVEHVSPAPQAAEPPPTQSAPYDQDADQGEPQQGEPQQGASQEMDADSSPPEAGYIDTATGEEVPVEDAALAEEEGTTGEHEDTPTGEKQEESVPAMEREEETRPQEDTWVPVEPAHVESASVEEPGDESADQPDERAAQRRDDAAAVTYGSPTEVGEDTTYAIPAHRAHDADNDPAGDQPGAPGPESRVASGSTAYATAEQTGQGFPAPESQRTDEAVLPPDQDDSVKHRSTDEDDHSRSDEPAVQEPDEPDEDEVDDQPVEDEIQPEPAPTWDERDDDVPSDAAAAGFEPPPSPYGPGTALPAEDGSGPDGWDIKGNAGSMLFHTPDSPSYAESRAEVWFESEPAARAAGFAHWDRKRR